MEESLDLNVKRDLIKLSYSRISSFDKDGPMSLVKRTFVQNEGATIGSLTDDLLNDIVNKTQEFDNLYYTYDGTKPTATLGKLADIIIEDYKTIPNKEEVLKLIKDNGFWSSTVKEDVLDKKYNTKEFWDYLKAQYASKEKTLATTSDIMWAQDLVDILLTHENSKYIFDNDDEKINQIKFQFNYKDFKLRGLLDILSINHKDKTVRMIDLKTGSNSVSEFVSSFIKWRYYIQEAVYTKAIDTILKDLKLEEYKVLPFQFLYISRYEKIPFVFEVGEKWHKAALNGFKTTSGWEYKGLEELLQEIKWHVNNKIYNCSKVMYEANGFMKLNDDFITIK